MKGTDKFHCLGDLSYLFPWYLSFFDVWRGKKIIGKIYLLPLKDHLSYIKCLPRLETQGTFGLGLFSVGGGKSLMGLWYLNVYFSLQKRKKTRDKWIIAWKDTQLILKLTLSLTAAPDVIWQAAALGCKCLHFDLKWSYWDLFWTYQKQLEQAVNIFSQQEQLHRSLKLGVPSWEWICCWLGFSCVLVGAAQDAELLTCCWVNLSGSISSRC